MKLSQEEINELTEEGWEHYQDGGCLCYAHGEDECACGAWEFWEQSE